MNAREIRTQNAFQPISTQKVLLSKIKSIVLHLVDYVCLPILYIRNFVAVRSDMKAIVLR